MRVVDALTIGEWHDNEEGSSHTRPPTDYDADHLLVRVIECIQGQVQMEMVCEPMLDYGATMARWSALEDDRAEVGHQALDAMDGRTVFRLFSDMRMGIEGNRVHARHTLREGEKCFCAMSWTEELGGPRTVEQAEAHLERTSHFWRTWLAEGTYPDHPWRLHLRALGAGAEGPHVHADRGAGGGADDLAAGDPAGVAQLGLPLLLDARRDVHAVGAARAGVGLGGGRLRAVRGGPGAQRGWVAADHVWDQGRQRA